MLLMFEKHQRYQYWKLTLWGPGVLPLLNKSSEVADAHIYFFFKHFVYPLWQPFWDNHYKNKLYYFPFLKKKLYICFIKALVP